MADPGQLYLDIYYGEGRMDVNLTNQIYEQRYGKTGQLVPGQGAYSNAQQAYQQQVYTNAQGTATAPLGSTLQNAPGYTAAPPAPPPAQAPQPTQGNTGGNQQPTTPTPTQGGTGDNPTGPSTADLLKEFLESDPDLMLNLVANKFRDMGASNVFMQWFTSNFNRFWGEFLGRIAAQAAAGQIPDMSFVDWVMGMDPNGQFFAAGGPSTGAPTAAYSNFVSQQGAA